MADAQVVGLTNMGPSLPSSSVKITSPHGSVYCTFVDTPCKELIVSAGKSGTEARAEAQALGKLASLALRKGASIEEVCRASNGATSQRANAERWEATSIADAVSLACKAWLGRSTCSTSG